MSAFSDDDAFDVVIPTIGRRSLSTLLSSIARSRGPLPGRVFIVDDRRDRRQPLSRDLVPPRLEARVSVLAGRAGGPASARNTGWRASRARYVAFLDDDVVVDDTWLEDLRADLDALTFDEAGSVGRVRVPLPVARKATDWERNVASLETATWITADCAYRRSELLGVGGFDERFPRAFREDADIALRIVRRGRRIALGRRKVVHPVRSASWSVSIGLQAGNADDALMRALHGGSWHARAGAPRGAFPVHVAIVATAGVAAIASASRARRFAAVAALAWAAQTLRFAWARIAPGPRTPAEIGALLVTSVAIPFAAVLHRVRGVLATPALLADRARAPQPMAAAVLFDRDGTLIEDVPDNADPERVVPMVRAREALDRARAAGLLTAVITNQPAVARGTLQPHDVDAINARMAALLGPVGPIFACHHDERSGCRCRKPAAGLIEDAARALDVFPGDCVVVGDIGSDVEAARRAGARAILVPTPVTLPGEVLAAPHVASDVAEAVRMIVAGRA